MNNVELRAARKVLDVTTADIASYFDVAARTWNSWEIGEAPVPAKIAEVLKSVLESRASLIDSWDPGDKLCIDPLDCSRNRLVFGWLAWVVIRSARREAFARGYVSLDTKTPLPPVAMRHAR